MIIRFLEYLHVLSFGHFFFRARYPKVLVPHIDPIQPTIVTLHNLVRHNLQNTTEKRIHCRKMSAGEERLFRDRKKCTYFMTSLAVLTIARLQSAMRATNCILTKSANLWTLFSAAVFGFLPKNVGSYVLRSFMSKSNVKKRKNESFWR